MTHDDETGKVTVQRGDLAERIAWLLKLKNDDLLGHDYYPNYLIEPYEVLGIMFGAA